MIFGVLMLFYIIIIYGYFKGEDDDEIFVAILRVQLASPEPDDISENVKNLIKKYVALQKKD